ncbi:MAG: hypothetical protein C4523_00620 [Myxococcales bacterium]|nr:MAG: hypothetical protein C4523_00620 [Myxococcales bacterium]
MSRTTILFALMLWCVAMFAGCGGGSSNGEETDADAQTDGDAAEDDDDADATDGDEDRPTDGDDSDGDATDDDLPTDGDVDVTDDDATDGDATDGDAADGDQPTDGDETDGDATDGDIDEGWSCIVDYPNIHTGFPYQATHTLAGADNTFESDCFDWTVPGADAAYSLTLDETMTVFVEVTVQGGGEVFVYVVGDCELSAECLVGAYNDFTSPSIQLHFRPDQAGIYYIVVDSRNPSDSTSYAISVDLAPPGTLAPGDACEADWQCSLESGAGRCFGDEARGIKACSIECDVPEDCALFPGGCCLEVPALQGSYCHVAASCGEAGKTASDGQACGSPETPNFPQCLPSLPIDACFPNTSYSYCSRVCTSIAQCGFFPRGCCIATLAGGRCLHENDCPHDCAADEEFGADGGTALGDLALADNSVNALGCLEGGSPGRDLVYRVDLDAGDRLTASLSGVIGFDPVLLLVDLCGWTDLPSNCFAAINAAGPELGEQLDYTAQVGGEYFLVVDSVDFRQPGSFFLTATIDGGGPDGDADIDDDAEEADDDGGAACQPDRAISRNELPIALDASTTSADNTLVVSGCLSRQMPGNDRLYAVALQQDDELTANLTNVGGWNPALFVYRDCANGACEEGVDNGVTGQGESLTYTVPADGTYYVVVDTLNGDAGNGGTFRLSLELTGGADGDEDVEEGEPDTSCTADFTIGTYFTLPYTRNGDTTDASHDVDIISEPNQCPGWAFTSPDDVYAISMQEGQSIRVQLTNVGLEYDPGVLVVEQCDLYAHCLIGADDFGFGGSEGVVFTAPANAIYFIVVDAPYETADTSGVGAYTLTVEQYNP